jgi:cytochrome c556
MRDGLRVRAGSLLMVLLIARSIGAGDRPDAVVKYRQSVMKAMAAHMTAISMVVRQEIANDRQLAAHAEAIHGLSVDLGEFFPAGTDAAKVKSAARPEIWRQPAEFKAAGAKLESESAKLLQLARQKGTASNAAPNLHALLTSQVDAVGAACKACHKTFRKSDTE